MTSLIIVLALAVLLISEKEAMSSDCTIPYSIMYSIANNERHPNRDVGYPYLISANNSSLKKCTKNLYPSLMIDSRTLDCKNTNKCVKTLSELMASCGDNYDVGAYQINTHYHRLNNESYFTLSESYAYSCSYIESIVSKKGWSWDSIATYHTSTVSLRNEYKKKILNFFEKEIY